MRPGLGVGGYCLTKDPSFAITSSKNIFKKNKISICRTCNKNEQKYA